ncbi:MAG: M4 family metallopeptidase [Bacteroidota bacterium]
MSTKFKLTFCLICLMSSTLLAQFKPIPKQKAEPFQMPAEWINIAGSRAATPHNPQTARIIPQSVPYQKSSKQATSFLVFKDETSQVPIAIKGELPKGFAPRGISLRQQAELYLEQVKTSLQIDAPREEFQWIRSNTDQHQRTHLRYQQLFKGIPVYGSELILHAKEGSIYLLNGRYYPSPRIQNVTPSIQKEAIEQLAIAQLPNFRTLNKDLLPYIAHEQIRPKLVIYHPDGKFDAERLAWKVDLIPSLVERYTYFLDAHSGEVLHQYSHICGLHPHAHEPTQLTGKTTARATDLIGANRTIDVYECQGNYFMIDAARDMYSGDESNCNDGDRLINGAILTLDANGKSPQRDDFDYTIAGSSNNQWNDATAVSAHYNGGQAYEYFLRTYGRNSINGQKGNIISFIHVTDEDGNDMDNAFWNGAAMFYGDGNIFFNKPLARGLDVAAHEMGHGVIQTTANLEYANQPGALNESFADIFGAMVDRDDWLIGEDVINPARYPSGAMRSMSDPNNGGNRNNFYWQPKHMNEFVELPNTPQGDNGGVHINSGIPNHAFYLFATDPSVGRSKAEAVYFDALENYLTRTSQFIDLRLSVIEAATVRYGANSAEVAAAAASFSAVGIGGGTRTDEEEEIMVNPGQDYILWSDDALTQINNATNVGTDGGTFTTTSHISKPSLSDDGAFIVYVGSDKNMYEMRVDWNQGSVTFNETIEATLDWRNVAISKDGNRIAAVTGDLNNGIFDNRIFIYDFISQNGLWFELYNPTTSQGVSTGDVLFADALEWDHSGEFLMYDAANRIRNNSGDDIEYWDIGFINVWDFQNNDFGNGVVFKLFSGLPDNVSVGNPSFSKNSPSVIVFDQLESSIFGSDEYSIQTANIQTGDQGVVFNGNSLGYPNYSKNDDRVIFHFRNNGTRDIIAIRNVLDDKLDGDGDATVFIEDAFWGVWFSTGQRELTSLDEELYKEELLNLYPNPTRDRVQIEFEQAPKGVYTLEAFDLRGRLLHQSQHSDQTTSLNTGKFASGTYLIRVQTDEKTVTRKLVIE